MPTYEEARCTISGRLIPMAEAYRRPATVVIETIHVSRNGVRRLKRRRPLDPDGVAGLPRS